MDFTLIVPWKAATMASVLGVYRIPLHHNEEHKHKILHIAFQNKFWHPSLPALKTVLDSSIQKYHILIQYYFPSSELSVFT